MRQNSLPLDYVEARLTLFSELQKYWNIPINDNSGIAGLTVAKGVKEDGTDDTIHILALNPLRIFSMNQESDKVLQTEIQGLIRAVNMSRQVFNLTTDNEQNVLVHEGNVSNFLKTHNQFSILIGIDHIKICVFRPTIY